MSRVLHAMKYYKLSDKHYALHVLELRYKTPTRKTGEINCLDC